MFEGKCHAFKNVGGIHEVKAMIFDVRCTFGF